jgi:hypothetical protein
MGKVCEQQWRCLLPIVACDAVHYINLRWTEVAKCGMFAVLGGLWMSADVYADSQQVSAAECCFNVAAAGSGATAMPAADNSTQGPLCSGSRCALLLLSAELLLACQCCHNAVAGSHEMPEHASTAMTALGLEEHACVVEVNTDCCRGCLACMLGSQPRCQANDIVEVIATSNCAAIDARCTAPRALHGFKFKTLGWCSPCAPHA